MTLRVVVRTVHKAGNRPDENEDAAGFAGSSQRLRLAVADGATEASFSDLWARALVDAWVAKSVTGLGAGILEEARSAWSARLPAYDRLPWHAQEKLALGAHAALACIAISEGQHVTRWIGQVVGDCEVFVLKGREHLWLRRSAPYSTSAAFGYHPNLVSTAPATWSTLRTLGLRGRMRPPFEFWVVTDAFAHSCLAAAERGSPPWDAWADALADADLFNSRVEALRSSGELRNDDVTVVRVTSSLTAPR
jgi:hypothetical protein